MKLEHEFTVPASVEDTWEAFNDLERVVPCFPGATLTSAEGDEFTGACKVKLGPISLQYNGTGKFVERDEGAKRAVLEAKGKDRRGNGTASATVTAQLTSEGAESTSVAVETDLAITGKPAQFGRGVMQDVSDKMLAQFVDCLQTKLGSMDAEPAPAEPSVPEPAEPSVVAPAEPSVVAPAVEPAGSETPAAQPPPESQPTRPRAVPSQPEPAAALDLGTTVLPVLAKRYGPYVLGVLLLILIVRRVLR